MLVAIGETVALWSPRFASSIPLLGRLGFYILFLFAWYSARYLFVVRLPSARIDQTGIVLCFRFGSDTNERRIREDFVQELERHLRNASPGARVRLWDVSRQVASASPTFDPLDLTFVKSLHDRCSARLVLGARFRDRLVDKSPAHLIDVRVSVRHSSTTPENQQRFAKELSELFPSRLLLPEFNDVFQFAELSESQGVFALYVLGIALFLSNEIDGAERLYLEAEGKTKGGRSAGIRVIRDRLPARLAEVGARKASLCHGAWLRTGDRSLGTQLLKYSGWCRRHLGETDQVLIMLAIGEFIESPDTDRALRALGKPRNPSAAWLVSFAFLKAYGGKLKEAYVAYAQAVKRGGLRDDAITNAEAFIDRVIQSTNRLDLLFLLGMLNFHFKHDLSAAKEGFERFIASGLGKSMHAIAENYLKRIERADR